MAHSPHDSYLSWYVCSKCRSLLQQFLDLTKIQNHCPFILTSILTSLLLRINSMNNYVFNFATLSSPFFPLSTLLAWVDDYQRTAIQLCWLLSLKMYYCITISLKWGPTLSETESKPGLSIYLLCHFEVTISQFSCLLKSLTSLSQVPYYWWPCLILEGRMKVKVKSLFATPWTVAYQVPPSMEFSRQEYWSGLPFPSPGDLPNPGIEPESPTM